MSFDKRLKRRMNEQNVTTTELAKLVGKSKSTISQYTSGASIPKDETVEKIAEVLQCDKEWFFEVEKNDEKKDGEFNKMTVSQVAKLLGKSEQFVRVALQQGVAPFGFAVKTSSKWCYHISEKKLYDYLGIV